MSKKTVLTAVAAVFCAALTVSGAPGDPYEWTAYNPNIADDLRNLPKVSMPTKDTVPASCRNNVTIRSDGWWSFIYGRRANGNLTTNNNRIVREQEIVTPLLARMNSEFNYIRDVMNWPPDSRAQRGYRSAVYLWGSGHGCPGVDNNDSTAMGGWQGSDGISPVVMISWVPVLAFWPTGYAAAGQSGAAGQTGGVIHEGIHAVLASMPNSRSVPHWFQEGGNTWIQKQADAQKSGVFGEWADLDAPGFMAPFMPIECYSGWLQDGSFGGPMAEGVNRNNAQGQQLCTWRTFLGGNQYGNGFPTFLGEWLGAESIAYIWMNATTNCAGALNSRCNVLGTMAKGLGEQQMRRLITEYRAKQAVLDLRNWTNGARLRMTRRFGNSIGPEGNAAGGNWIPDVPRWTATPYAITTNDGNGVLTPDPLTLPGWSGANQIPLTIPATMNSVTVDFMPDTANMSIQLAYRDATGRAVYSEPVSVAAGRTGQVTLNLLTAPSMGPTNITGNARRVVIAVISNSDYLFRNDATRFAKYKYKIKIPAGVTTANVNTAWFNITSPGMAMSPVYKSSGDGSTGIASKPAGRQQILRDVSFNVSSNNRDGVMRVSYSIGAPANVNFDVYNTAGALVKTLPAGYKAAGGHKAEFNMRSMGVPSGMYVVKMRGAQDAAPKVAAFVK